MEDPFIDKFEIEIHPTIMKEYRDILHFMLKYAYPQIIPQISRVLLSYPFECSRFDELVLMVMDNRGLFREEEYDKLSYMVMKHYTEYDLDPPTSDYVLAPFHSLGFKIYEILERYPLEYPAMHRRFDPTTLGRAMCYRLCKEYMEEEGFLDKNNRKFQIYLCEKDPSGAFLRLHFQRSESEVTDENIEKLLNLSNQIYSEYKTIGHYVGYIDK